MMKGETRMPAAAAVSLRSCHSASVIITVRCFLVASFMRISVVSLWSLWPIASGLDCGIVGVRHARARHARS